MYANLPAAPTGTPGHSLGRAARALLTLAAAALIGFGIPAAWLYAAGAIQSGHQGLAFGAALVAFGGIAGSYIGLIAAAGWARGLGLRRRGEQAPIRRYNWNRSMRDERHMAPELTALENLFVVTALLVGGAYMFWFLVYAGSSLPGSP